MTFKYTQEIVDRMVQDYHLKIPVEKIAGELKVPTRSVIAKLSSLGVYRKREYRTKQGTTPVAKAELIEQLATQLECAPELLDSLEKCNKLVLQRILTALKSTQSDPKPG